MRLRYSILAFEAEPKLLNFCVASAKSLKPILCTPLQAETMLLESIVAELELLCLSAALLELPGSNALERLHKGLAADVW